MRFHLGAIPHSPDFAPHAPWNSVREPPPWLMQLIALPIGIVSALSVGVLWHLITPLRGGAMVVTPLGALLVLVASVGVHELVHASAHPLMGRSPHSVLGFWPSRGVFYAHYDGELSRNHFVTIFVAPLCVLSLLPLLAAAFMQVGPGWLAFVSSLNALLASGDILGAVVVLAQIPSTAMVRNQGWRTYWRPAERAAATR
jgi:hypothetical protein